MCSVTTCTTCTKTSPPSKSCTSTSAMPISSPPAPPPPLPSVHGTAMRINTAFMISRRQGCTLLQSSILGRILLGGILWSLYWMGCRRGILLRYPTSDESWSYSFELPCVLRRDLDRIVDAHKDLAAWHIGQGSSLRQHLLHGGSDMCMLKAQLLWSTPRRFRGCSGLRCL